MKFEIPETVPLAGGAVSELLQLGDGDAALLYLYITISGSKAPAQASSDLSWDQERTLHAFDELISLGLIPETKAVSAADLHPSVKAQPVAKARNAARDMHSEKRFHTLAQEVQRLFARVLSSDELVRLFSIYDSLGLPPEVILQLIVYCTAETRDGTSPPSMRYIEKAAYTWEREGILTLEHAERYIKERAERKRESAKIKAALQIEGRNFTPTERKYIDGWLALGYSAEAVAIAYDRTVTKTGKLSWNYMNSIINSWHGKGLYTGGDILAKDNRPVRGLRFGGVEAADTPDDKELDRINRILRGLNEEN